MKNTALLENKKDEKTKYHTAKDDRVFKAVFLNTKDNDYHLLESLLEEILEGKVKVDHLIPNETKIRNVSERNKRLDALIYLDGRKINLELNASYDKADLLRNFRFFTAFYSSSTKVGKKYDDKTEFIHISLNFINSPNRCKPLKSVYTMFDEEHHNTLIDGFKYIELNMDKYKNFWYTKNEKEINKAPLLVSLDLDKEELNKFNKESGNENTWEVQMEVERLNENEFKYDLTPEEDAEYTFNTKLSIAEEEGLKKGLKKTAKKMLKNNISIDLIKECTGLSENEILKLK